MENAIIINNITKKFADITALDNISLTIKKQEIFGLIGPDGAGKSTLMKILATLYLPDKGEAYINGLDVVKDYKQVRKHIGYMPGEFSLYHDLTVEENLAFFATIFNTTIEKNYELIKPIYSHIEPFKKRRAGALSGGMKQKLALSCALIHSPQVLILDEPNTGVDAISRNELWNMLYFLKEKGLTIIVSTPYMDEAEKCDRIALMQEGKLLAVDSPSNIISSFNTQLFSIEGENLYNILQVLKNFNNIDHVYLFGQEIHFTSKSNSFKKNELETFLKNHDIENFCIKEISPTIEDCFINFMDNK